MKTKKLSTLVWMFLGCFLLSACNSKMNVWFYEDSSWKVLQTFEYDPDDLPSFSGEILEGLSIDLPLGGLADISTQLAAGPLVQYYLSKGVQAEFDTNKISKGMKGYTLELQGQGLDSLQNIGLGGEGLAQASGILGNIASTNGFDPSFLDQLNVSVVPLGGNEYHLQISSLPALMEYTFVLNAGRIISSNADKVFLGKATWNNPTRVDVVFTPVGGIFDTKNLVLAGVLFVISLVLMIGLLFLSRTAGSRRAKIHQPISSKKVRQSGNPHWH